jgi:hypothetical protein
LALIAGNDLAEENLAKVDKESQILREKPSQGWSREVEKEGANHESITIHQKTLY